jgi:hypothetical protein
MTCPQLDEIILFLDGELSVNRSDELRPHLQQCSVCSRCCEELRRTIGRLAPGPDDVDAALVRDIVSRASSGAEAAPRVAPRWRRWTLPAVGLAAAATLLAVLFGPAMLRHGDPRSDDRAFTARGGPGADPRRDLALWIYQRNAATRTYAEVREGATIRADAQLVFGLSQEGAYRYLMIFGVSERGQVFWYYPAYLSKDSDPTSIPIGRGRQELREEIQHDLPAGRLRITALFSKQALHVSTIERLLRSRGKLGLSETAEVRRTVIVTAPATH